MGEKNRLMDKTVTKNSDKCCAVCDVISLRARAQTRRAAPALQRRAGSAAVAAVAAAAPSQQ